jgi:CheY-like chemotaxis protein
MNKFKFDHVTIVDDDLVVKILMVKILRNIGFQGVIHQFENGEKALNEIPKLSHELPSNGLNLILLDINMPVMDGWQFLEKITFLPDNWKKNQFITMITSSIDRADKNKAMSYAEVNDFIQKPVSIQQLKDFLMSHHLIEE